MKRSIAEVDPLRIRMIGAIFWALLLIYLIPLWFQNPVVFSPDGSKVSSLPLTTMDAQNTTHLSSNLSPNTEQGAAEHSELFIEKPLTTTPPPADPQRVQALTQPLSVREAQVDEQGRLSVATAESRLAMSNAPTTSIDGHYWVQIATYQVESMALSTQTRIRPQGFVAKVLVTKNKKGHVNYVLRVGPYKTHAEANAAKSIIDARLKTKSMVLKK